MIHHILYVKGHNGDNTNQKTSIKNLIDQQFKKNTYSLGIF